MNYIKLYAEDFDTDVWEGYCRAAGVPTEATVITIKFNDKDVYYKGPETFVVDIYDPDDNYIDSFDIVARDKQEAEDLVEYMGAAFEEKESFYKITVYDSDENERFTFQKGKTPDIEDWVNSLSFKLVIIR